MTKSEKDKLVATNAALWAVASLASFVLPLIADGLTEGRSNFLRMLMHVLPLLATIMISSARISAAIGEPSDPS